MVKSVGDYSVINKTILQIQDEANRTAGFRGNVKSKSFRTSSFSSLHHDLTPFNSFSISGWRGLVV